MSIGKHQQRSRLIKRINDSPLSNERQGERKTERQKDRETERQMDKKEEHIERQKERDVR